MELNRGDAGEMYSPDDQGEYVPKAGMQNFSIQGLSDVLMSLESEVTGVQSPAEEYALLLDITVADQPGCPHPPAFSWNASMVLHILKGDPALWNLEHVQVDHTIPISIHHDAGHQGQQRTLALAQEHFWWPMMVEDCKVLVRECPRCHMFEGVIPKAPPYPVRVHTPLELVPVDFTSVESTMELNKLSSIKNILVIMDHFMHYALAVMTKDQTAKTIAEVLFERFITMFGVPAKLLSNWRANFTSVLVEELCATFGIQKCWTTAYHPQCNGQVEHFHQMLFRMIDKLASDKKTQWELHLPELLQVYNSTRSAITGYSPHYLIFGRCPHLPVDFYFPTKGTHVCSRRIPVYVEEVRKHFKEAYTKAHLQTNSEAE